MVQANIANNGRPSPKIPEMFCHEHQLDLMCDITQLTLC